MKMAAAADLCVASSSRAAHLLQSGRWAVVFWPPSSTRYRGVQQLELKMWLWRLGESASLASSFGLRLVESNSGYVVTRLEKQGRSGWRLFHAPVNGDSARVARFWLLEHACMRKSTRGWTIQDIDLDGGKSSQCKSEQNFTCMTYAFSWDV